MAGTKRKRAAKIARSGQRIGYARVSTAGQNLDGQTDALHVAGCAKIFTDTITGTSKTRPGWDALMTSAWPGAADARKPRRTNE